ncbi:MAG: hypothetical protein AAF356_06320 [Planctomycetota bacterium]
MPPFPPKSSSASSAALACPACRYDLSATAPRADGRLRCPECGRLNTPQEAAPPPTDARSVAERTARGGLSLAAGCALLVFILAMLTLVVVVVGGAIWTLFGGAP